MKQKSRFRTARRILIFWTLFIGLGAVAGALGMLLDPSGKSMGMDAMLPFFQVLPFADVVFQDFTFSGWALLIVNGLTNLTAAGLLLAKKHSGVVHQTNIIRTNSSQWEMGSDYLFSSGDLRKPISETASSSGQNPSRESQGKRSRFR